MSIAFFIVLSSSLPVSLCVCVFQLPLFVTPQSCCSLITGAQSLCLPCVQCQCVRLSLVYWCALRFVVLVVLSLLCFWCFLSMLFMFLSSLCFPYISASCSCVSPSNEPNTNSFVFLLCLLSTCVLCIPPVFLVHPSAPKLLVQSSLCFPCMFPK